MKLVHFLQAWVRSGPWIRIHFFSDPDPAVLLNADPYPAAFLRRILTQIQLNNICKKFLMKSWKRQTRLLKSKNHGAGPNLLNVLNEITITVLPIFLHFFSFFLLFEWKWMRIHADPDPQPWLRYILFEVTCQDPSIRNVTFLVLYDLELSLH